MSKHTAAFYIDDRTEEIITRIQERMFEENRSAALRFIVKTCAYYMDLDNLAQIPQPAEQPL